MFVLSLLVLSNPELMCCTELTAMASTVTLEVGFNFREVTDFSDLQGSFSQPWDAVAQAIAKESCSGANASPEGKGYMNRPHRTKNLWKMLVAYVENRG